MKLLSVMISDDAYTAAKVATAKSGLLLRLWVERAVETQAGVEEYDRKHVERKAAK
jgi:hypothetical protein